MRTGYVISGAGHVVLIGFVLFGGWFPSDRIPEVSVSEVSVISEEEFAALVLPGAAPEAETDAPEVAAPSEDTAPEVPQEDAAPEISEPAPVEVPEPPDAPDVEIPEPPTEAVVVDTAPPVPAAPSDLDGTTAVPDQLAAPAPRVAPVPQVAPAPEVESAPDIVQETAPDPEALPDEQVEPEVAEAPEAASDRTVTEAEEQQNYAPASSMRPRARPSRPVRVAEPNPEPEAETPSDNVADAIADAVAEANDRPAETDAPVRRGPPLTGGEKEALRVAVSSCWNVGSLSTDALGTTVVVGVEMEQSGKPISGSIKLVSSSGGSQSGQQQAFEAARRAIIRCGVRGF
ncbi:unnamed protein product, partial [Ectocarpus sp. 12 AP-2014]